MAITANTKGTSYPSFKIGKNGVTVFQGTAAPNGTNGIDGDIYFRADGTDSTTYQKIGGAWIETVNQNLRDIGALTPATNNFIVGDGTAWITESGSTVRESLGLSIGTDVLAYDADLETIAGLAHVSGNVIRSNGTVWQSTTVSLNDLGDAVITTPSNTQFLRYNGTNWINETVTVGTGDVTGVGTVGFGALMRADGTNGKSIQDSGLAVDANTTLITTKSTNWRKSEHVLIATTADGTASTMFQDGTTGEITLDNNTTVGFQAIITARRTDADNESAVWHMFGCIDRNGSAASTALVGTVEITANKDTPATTWSAVAVADTTGGGLRFTVTGEAGKNIRWMASVTTHAITG